MFKYLKIFIYLFVAFNIHSVQAEPAHANWQTLTTKNFRFHFTPPYEEWTRKVAGQMEHRAEEIHQVVGYKPRGVVDFVVFDPLNVSNGFTVASSYKSRIALYARPPEADSILGQNSDWSDLLVTHEYVHAAHMSRPTRRFLFELLSPVWINFSLLNMDIPRWAVEGYATFLEGKITSSGRPYSDLRATVIRTFAADGQLPNYEQLENIMISDNWQKGTLMYNVGAAFYQWLAVHYGDEKFRDLWIRLTGKDDYEFKKAFLSVFGDEPEVLYQNFSAELTSEAFQAKKKLSENTVPTQLWQKFKGRISKPAVSSDGKYIAVVSDVAGKPAKLQVFLWEEQNAKGLEEWNKDQEKLLKNDPKNIKAKQPSTFERESQYSLGERNDRTIQYPSWIPQTKKILYTAMSNDVNNLQRGDLFVWDLENNSNSQITKFAGVWRASPTPDGQSAIAVRYLYGKSELVKIDLKSGQIEPLLDGGVQIAFDQPRVRPDGQGVAYLKHMDGKWRLCWYEFASKKEIELLSQQESSYLSDHNWSLDGKELYFSQGEKSFIQLYKMNWSSKEVIRMTNSFYAPLGVVEIANTSKIMFSTLNHEGMQLVTMDKNMQSKEALPIDPTWNYVVNKVGSKKPHLIKEVDQSPAQPYGLGPQGVTFFYSAQIQQHADNIELGLKGGDMLGRLDWLVAGSLSKHHMNEGGAGWLAWKRWPLHLKLFAYQRKLDPNQNWQIINDLPASWKEKNQGILSRIYWEGYFGSMYAALSADYHSGQFEDEFIKGSKNWTAGKLNLTQMNKWGWFALGYHADARLIKGQTDGRKFDILHYVGEITLGQYKNYYLNYRYSLSEISQDSSIKDWLRLGGSAGIVTNDANSPSQIFDDFLPVGSLVGQKLRTESLNLQSFDLVVSNLFYKRYEMQIDQLYENIQYYGYDVTIKAGDKIPVPEIRGLELGVGYGVVKSKLLRGDQSLWLRINYNI